MIRKATALALLVLLGLYLPAAAMPVCLCLGPQSFLADPCCQEEVNCCDSEAADASDCCGDPECCVLVSGIPDGMEPQAQHLPPPLAAPLPVVTIVDFAVVPMAHQLALCRPSGCSPPTGDPVRIAFGVWRL